MYPGASPESVDNTVASVIEESLDGAEGLQYYETTSDSLGELEIAATFSPGTNPDIAMVDVQNRLKQVEPRLPQQVVQQGISVFKSTGHVPDARRAHVHRRPARFRGTERLPQPLHAARTEARAGRWLGRIVGRRTKRCGSGSIR